MTNFVLLNNVDHKNTKVSTGFSKAYGDDVMYSMIFPFEFRNIQAEYPILFHKDLTHGITYPIALFGFEEKDNLYLEGDSWGAHYKPVMIRRQPFLIGFQGEKSIEEDNRKRVVSIDMDNPRVNSSGGESLFDEIGVATPFLANAANMLEAIHDGHTHNEKFVAALEAQELIEPLSIDVTLGDGSVNQLLGFHFINEERLQELPGEVLEEFNKKGYLMPIFMMLASMANMRTLVNRKNKSIGVV